MWNWKKTAGSRWTCFGVRVPKTLDCPTINLNPPYRAPHDHNARPTQSDRRTNITAIARRFVLTNASRAKNFLELFTHSDDGIQSHFVKWETGLLELEKRGKQNEKNNNPVLNKSVTEFSEERLTITYNEMPFDEPWGRSSLFDRHNEHVVTVA